MNAEQLVNQAWQARKSAYAPYSGFRVGASVLTQNGQVFLGCNVEVASYGGTICAERVALTAAVANGRGPFVAIAVATANGGSPCGTCRQVMAELGPAMTVYITDAHGNVRTTTVADLLPDSFTGEHLVTL